MQSINMAVVGLGSWGKNVARCFAHTPGVTLRYLCDANEKRLQTQGQLYPQAQTTKNYDDILANDTVDAIALVTPAPSHFALGMQALMAGKHIFVEKPMTLSTADARTLCHTANVAGKTLMVGHLLEYHPAVAWMKAYVESGALGDPLYIYSQRLNLGTVRSEENAFWSLAPHDISVILYLFGCEPSQVTAHGECYLQPGIEDVVFAYLRFPDQRSAQIHVSWLDPHKERRIVLVGTRTMIVFDDMQPLEPIRIFNKGAVVPESGEGMAQVTVRHGDVLIPHFPASEPLMLECQHFIDCVRDGIRPRSDGQDGMRVVRVLEAASASLHAEGQPIKVESDGQSTTSTASVFRA
ncbi:MAG: Gfo/Idh/MocA family protein [Armatimonadota bacterium]